MNQRKDCWITHTIMLSEVVRDENMGDYFFHKLLNIFKFSMTTAYCGIHNEFPTQNHFLVRSY